MLQLKMEIYYDISQIRILYDLKMLEKIGWTHLDISWLTHIHKLIKKFINIIKKMEIILEQKEIRDHNDGKIQLNYFDKNFTKKRIWI